VGTFAFVTATILKRFYNTSAVAKPTSTDLQGSLELQTQLSVGETESVDNTYDVVGTIEYSLEQSEQEGFYTFAIVTDASVQSLASNSTASKIFSQSSDWLEIPAKRSISHEKVYEFEGFDRRLELHITFNLSSNGVYIESVGITESSQM